MNVPEYSQVEGQLRRLQGEVLTIVEAAALETQNKAVKDLIKQSFNRRMLEVWRIFNKNYGRNHEMVRDGMREIS